MSIVPCTTLDLKSKYCNLDFIIENFRITLFDILFIFNKFLNLFH